MAAVDLTRRRWLQALALSGAFPAWGLARAAAGPAWQLALAWSEPGPIATPGAERDSDKTAPVLSDVSVTGGSRTVSLRFTLSEAAAVSARFVPTSGDRIATTYRVGAQAGTSTIERSVAKGTYSVQLTAVDAFGNHSLTYTSEVKIRG